MKERDTPN